MSRESYIPESIFITLFIFFFLMMFRVGWNMHWEHTYQDADRAQYERFWDMSDRMFSFWIWDIKKMIYTPEQKHWHDLDGFVDKLKDYKKVHPEYFADRDTLRNSVVNIVNSGSCSYSYYIKNMGDVEYCVNYFLPENK